MTTAPKSLAGAAQALALRADLLVNLMLAARDAPADVDPDNLLEVAIEYAQATQKHTEALEALICAKPGTEGGAA